MDGKKQAKMEMLKDLKENMKKEMGKGLGDKISKMKVMVASDSKKGLEEGLSKAQELMKKKFGDLPRKMEESEDMAEEMMEAPEMEDESEESEEMEAPESKEDIEAQIEELKAKLASME